MAGAWLFYTVFPPIPFISPKFKNIAQFAPFIGLLLGSLQSFIYLFLRNNSWSIHASVSLCIMFGFLITGGIHIDGLMDTFDGLYAGKRKMIKAMKDSKVGSFGVQAVLVIVLVQFAALSTIDRNILWVLPVSLFWGRFSNLIYINQHKYINKKSKTISHKKYWRGIKKEAIVSFILFLLIINFYLLYTESFIELIKNFTLNFLGLFVSFIVPSILGNKVGGFNGDTCGASIVITETIILLLYSFVL